jgi:hypothetical protein
MITGILMLSLMRQPQAASVQAALTKAPFRQDLQ